MPHLTSIAASNLKGRSFTYALGRCTLIAAPNWSGKSAITEAVRLALGGYLPERGKQNQDTMKLCAGNSMRVEVTADTGHLITRQWTRTPKGVEQSRVIGAEGFDTHTPLLNPDEYFSLSANAQIDYIFTRTKMPDGYDVARIEAAIDEIIEASEDITADDEEAIEAIKGWARKEIGTDPETFAGNLTAFLGDKGKLKTEYTIWNRKARDTQGAVTTLNEMTPDAWQFSEATLRGVAIKIGITQGRVKSAAEALGGLRSKRDAVAKHAKRKAEIEAILAEPAPDHAATIAKMEKRKAGLLEQIRPVDQVLLNEVEELVASLGTALGTAERLRDGYKAKAAELTKELEASATVESCDKCGCSGKTFLKLRSQLAASIQADLDAQNELAAEHDKAADKASTELAAAQLRKNAFIATATDNEELQEEIDGLESEIRSLHMDIDLYKSDRQAVGKELAAMTEPGEVDDAALAKLEADAEAADAELNALRETERAAIAKRETYRNQQTAKHEHEQAVSFKKTITAVQSKIKAVQAEMIAEVIGPICDTANRIAGDILRSPLCFHEGEIGRMGEQGFISAETFSTGEKALASVATAAALSSQATYRLLILDELGVLSAKKQGEILKRLAQAVEDGLLHQVICCVPRDTPVSVPGWNVINIEE